MRRVSEKDTDEQGSGLLKEIRAHLTVESLECNGACDKVHITAVFCVVYDPYANVVSTVIPRNVI